MFEAEKVVVRVRTNAGGTLAASHDDEGMFCDHTVLVCCPYEAVEGTSATTNFEGFDKVQELDLSLKYLLSLLNSTLMTWVFKNKFETGGLQGSYSDVWPQSVRLFPVPKGEQDLVEAELPDKILNLSNNTSYETALSTLSDNLLTAKTERQSLNLHLPDYLTNYGDGSTLGDLASPPAGVSNTLLTETTDDIDRYEKLRIDGVAIERVGTDLTLSAVPYVKPVESVREEYDTNSRDYATLDPVPAMKFYDLDCEQADLIESFVPYAVGEAGGFMGFYDNATKTITPLDRLEALTLPALDDVRDGLADYRDAVERAEELDERIERTDELIDEIVYELYGLTDEEIEIVEEAVGN